MNMSPRTTRPSLARSALLIAQAALSVVLLIGAAPFVNSLNTRDSSDATFAAAEELAVARWSGPATIRCSSRAATR